MRYFAVIDTNVLASAMLKHNSVPGKVMEYVLVGPIIPVFNAEIFSEYREVLSRPKFKFPQGIIDEILFALESRGLRIDAESIDIELPDPKDRVFYEVVLEKRKSEDAYLVTGNIKHFPVTSFVVTPKEMLDIVLTGTERRN